MMQIIDWTLSNFLLIPLIMHAMILPDIFKVTKTRWLSADGKRVKANSPGANKVRVKLKDWYAEIPVVETPRERLVRKKAGKRKPRPQRVRLCQNKRAAKEMVRELVESAERKAAGLVDYASANQQPTGELVDRYRDHLLAKGNSDEYVQLTINRIETVFAACRFFCVSDLNADTAAIWLYKQRKVTATPNFDVRGFASSYKEIGEVFGAAERTVTCWKKQGAPITPRGQTSLANVSEWLNSRNTWSMGASTSNHYVTALRGFGRWLLKSSFVINANPFESLEKIDARADVRKSRRVLSRIDFSKLIHSTHTNKWKFRSLTGEDRGLIYVVAAYRSRLRDTVR